MRFASFALAFALLFTGPIRAGSADGSVPAAGVFAYDSAPAMTPGTVMMASIR